MIINHISSTCCTQLGKTFFRFPSHPELRRRGTSAPLAQQFPVAVVVPSQKHAGRHKTAAAQLAAAMASHGRASHQEQAQVSWVYVKVLLADCVCDSHWSKLWSGFTRVLTKPVACRCSAQVTQLSGTRGLMLTR